MNEMMEMNTQEVLALWRREMNFDLERHDCSIERADGISLDDLLLMHINEWYAHLLSTAPLEWVPVSDVSGEVQVTADAAGVVTMPLPERCVRPVEVMLQGWQQPVCEFAAPDSEVARLQHIEWLRGGCRHPVAVRHVGYLRLYSVPAGMEPVVSLARMVMRPPHDSYVFAREAVSTIPQYGTLLGIG